MISSQYSSLCRVSAKSRLYSLILAVFLCAGVFIFSSGAAFASGDSTPPRLSWSFSGVTGTYDKAALQRGYKIYREVCSACHSMKYVYYRNLKALGYDEGQIKYIAAQYSYMDGPDDEGEMFERPGLPSDPFKSPFENSKQAAAANNNAVPPDFSLIAKARAGGPDYIYGILTGFEEHAPHGHKLLDGQYWNKYMNGHVISMAPPLSDGAVTYEDGTPEILGQYARDVAQFLMWAADPYMEERKRTGIKVILFLLVFTGVMYALKRIVWSDAH